MRSHGFTLVEMVTTLIIVGIIGIFAVGRLDFNDVFEQRGVRDKVVAALQFVRKAAVAQRRYVCVVTNGGTVSFTIDTAVPENTASAFGGTCPFAQALALPVADRDCGVAGNAVCSRGHATIGGGNFQFDPQGRASATTTFTVTGQSSITVEGESGHVH